MRNGHAVPQLLTQAAHRALGARDFFREIRVSHKKPKIEHNQPIARASTGTVSIPTRAYVRKSTKNAPFDVYEPI